MMSTIEVRVPDIGDFKDIPVIETLVKPGDHVVVDQAVVTLESDKATLDVPTPSAGKVTSLLVSAGARVSRGSLIMTLEVDDSTRSSLSEAIAPRSVPSQSATAGAASSTSEAKWPQAISTQLSVDGASPGPNVASVRLATSRVYASPSIRRLGRELGANLAKVVGTGRGGRILLEDVHQAVREELHAPRTIATRAALATSSPQIDFSKFGDIERQPLSRIRRISGSVLAKNWATIPHVTNFDEADVTDLEAFRVQLNQELRGDPKVTLLSFLIKAVAVTLRHAPAFNASLDGEELVLKKYVNIGVGVDTPGGLVVPVIRNADKLGLLDIARALTEKSVAAHAGKLKPADFEGGCFTISSLGGIGGTGFTPIINAPEIAILGVVRAALHPRFDGTEFKPRLILPLALSWDHRATDGVAAARFLVKLASLLQDFRRASL